ncbi:hypothetical protein M422DRAFT_257522 [Sphaerobolus stellatus SS14]|uniref:Ubiquitin-like protease family profile domain-containing protein n=1 Tax=Sphaerobolus stellatus (strain SS14) TaxID=990650 RepID=A0A0C9U9E9_SPHS4|nr:hypothetical protein M422DRAFT_257522 [Sphaerobolus stellatus SS14]
MSSMGRQALAGSRRKAKQRKSTARKEKEVKNNPDYSLKSAEDIKAIRQPHGAPRLPTTPRKGAIIAMPFGQTFVQTRTLPGNTRGAISKSKQAKSSATLSSTNTGSSNLSPSPPLDPITSGDDDMWGLDLNRIITHEVATECEQEAKTKQANHGRYAHKKANQFRRWVDSIIPNLLPQYLKLQRLTEQGRLPVPASELDAVEHRLCTCNQVHPRLRVAAAYWNRLEDINLVYCSCKPASELLLARGLFPCAPLRPSVAFDINLLDLVSISMFYITPSISGWGLSLEWFWKERGYMVGQREFIKRRFAASYQWYNVLRDSAKDHVNARIQEIVQSNGHSSSMRATATARTSPMTSNTTREHIPDEVNTSRETSTTSSQSGIAIPSTECVHVASLPFPQPSMLPSLPSNSASTPTLPSVIVNALNPTSTSGNTPNPSSMSGNDLHSPSTSTDIHSLPPTSNNPPSPPSNIRTRPSEHLRSSCPLCFGGERPALLLSKTHCVVAINANFAQKCLKPRSKDVPLVHPQTQFIPKSIVTFMEEYIEVQRKRKPKATTQLNLRLPEEVLAECEDSFIAAQETEVKASVVTFMDTGLVAMVCCHDRLLWLINMTTPGERQHYAYTLIKLLFKHLPDDWNVGLLYDIACQIERSMIKHNILPELYDRLAFAVSVFHAYGHQWPCQLLYHPRKAVGFGLSDGEGCERFWSSLKRLISSLRVSGCWVIDHQIIHNKADTMRNLGSFITRKRKVCSSREEKARKILRAHCIGHSLIRDQWSVQVMSQTAPLRKFSKKTVNQLVDSILEMRTQHEEHQSRIVRLEKQVAASLERDEEDYTLALEELKTERELGATDPQKLLALKDSAFLRIKLHAKALKIQLRKKLVDQKFERSRLDKAYQQQVVRDKDHQQTKSLLKCSREAITSLVSRYNKLVGDMEAMKKRGMVGRRVDIPTRLNTEELYRLDVDDAIWLDALEEGEDSAMPCWMSDEAIRPCIPALLECDRVAEEWERLNAEEGALKGWLREEINELLGAKALVLDNVDLTYQINLRLADLWNVSEHWRRVLDKFFLDQTCWMKPSERPAFSQLIEPSILDPGPQWGVRFDTQAGNGNEDTDESVIGTSSEISEEGEEELLQLLEDELRREMTYANSTAEEDVVEAEQEVAADEANVMIEPQPMKMPSNHSENNNVVVTAMDGNLESRETMLGWMADVSTLMATRKGKNMRSCGEYYCDLEYVIRLIEGGKWFDGSVITVVTEAMAQSIGDDAMANHITPKVLSSARRLRDEGDVPAVRETVLPVIIRHALKIFKGTEKVWVIPTHVPNHWTLVAVHVTEKTIRFYDSLPQRYGAVVDETRVGEEVTDVLNLAWQKAGKEGPMPKFKWISEERPARQVNGYNCGAFVLADIASYMRYGVPSDCGQDRMPAWRAAFVELLCALERVTAVPHRRMGPTRETPVWDLDA